MSRIFLTHLRLLNRRRLPILRDHLAAPAPPASSRRAGYCQCTALAHLSLRCAGFRCSNSFYQLSEMQTTSRLLLLALTLVFSGCAQDVANRYYASERYPAKDVNDVNLLYSAPSREFTVIADFQSRNESPQGMRIRAAKIGADAIIITPAGGSYRLNEQWAGNDSMSHSYSRLVGSVIKYRK